MKIKSNFMLRLASFLFICVIVSTVTLAGLLARYVTSDGGSDSARVASFSVSASSVGDGEDGNVPTDKIVKYVITLNNNSEVAVRCDIDIQLKDPLEDYYSFQLDSKNPVVSSDKKTLTFSSVKDLSVGEIGTTVELLINMDYDKWTENKTGLSTSDSLEFSTNVTFVQID